MCVHSAPCYIQGAPGICSGSAMAVDKTVTDYK